MEIVKNNGLSVLIQTKSKLQVWLDCEIIENELNFDWNKYLFNLKDSKDIEIKTFQESTDNFIMCCELATDYLIQKGLIS
jgi:hypothetical protein